MSAFLVISVYICHSAGVPLYPFYQQLQYGTSHIYVYVCIYVLYVVCVLLVLLVW